MNLADEAFFSEERGRNRGEEKKKILLTKVFFAFLI